MNRHSKLYERLARAYLEGNKTVHRLCLEDEERTGFYPNPRSVYAHIKKLREKEQVPYVEFLIIWGDIDEL